MLNKGFIGMNIRDMRNEKKMTQRQLADIAHISTTQLSAYENGKQLPGLVTIAEIASALGASIDELCYGDSSESFIRSSSSEGMAIVNSLAKLYLSGLISDLERINNDPYDSTYHNAYLKLSICETQIERLLDLLYDYTRKYDTFDDPEAYYSQFMKSVAKEIDSELAYRR